VGGADFGGGLVFSDKTFAGVGVTTPRHKWYRVLTIEKMLGFGYVDPISLLPDFFVSIFSFNSRLMVREACSYKI